MQNVNLFNNFVLQILNHLYDQFPVPTAINTEDFISKVEFSPYPPRPVNIDCGPDVSWFFMATKEQKEEMWTAHPWGQKISEIESILSRALTVDERGELLRTGRRPLTVDEQQLMIKWEDDKLRIDSLRLLQKVQLEEAEMKQAVFIATIQFLTNEKLIRFVDLPPATSSDDVLNPPDILIFKSIKSLQFVLTSNSFIHLNRPFADGKLSEKINLYQAIKRTLKEKAVNGVGNLVMGAAGDIGLNLVGHLLAK